MIKPLKSLNTNRFTDNLERTLLLVLSFNLNPVQCFKQGFNLDSYTIYSQNHKGHRTPYDLAIKQLQVWETEYERSYRSLAYKKAEEFNIRLDNSGNYKLSPLFPSANPIHYHCHPTLNS